MDDLTLAAKERRSLRRWQFVLVAVALIVAVCGFLATALVAVRLDKSNDLARQQRCSFALQGAWNRAIVNYLDAITQGGTPQDRDTIRKNLNLIAEQQAQRSVCP